MCLLLFCEGGALAFEGYLTLARLTARGLLRPLLLELLVLFRSRITRSLASRRLVGGKRSILCEMELDEPDRLYERDGVWIAGVRDCGVVHKISQSPMQEHQCPNFLGGEVRRFATQGKFRSSYMVLDLIEGKLSFPALGV